VIDNDAASEEKAVSNGAAWKPLTFVSDPRDGRDVFTMRAQRGVYLPL